MVNPLLQRRERSIDWGLPSVHGSPRDATPRSSTPRKTFGPVEIPADQHASFVTRINDLANCGNAVRSSPATHRPSQDFRRSVETRFAPGSCTPPVSRRMSSTTGVHPDPRTPVPAVNGPNKKTTSEARLRLDPPVHRVKSLRDRLTRTRTQNHVSHVASPLCRTASASEHSARRWSRSEVPLNSPIAHPSGMARVEEGEDDAGMKPEAEHARRKQSRSEPGKIPAAGEEKTRGLPKLLGIFAADARRTRNRTDTPPPGEHNQQIPASKSAPLGHFSSPAEAAAAEINVQKAPDRKRPRKGFFACFRSPKVTDSLL